MTTHEPPAAGDLEEPFPPAFLRLLSAIPALVRRTRSGAAAGVHAARGPGGPFLFRSHREYRAGDDLRRVDWGVLARHDKVVVREFEAERDARTDVWLDASASTGAGGGRPALLRATAIVAVVGLCGGGRARIGLVRDGQPDDLCDADDLAEIPSILDALRRTTPSSRAGWAEAFPRLVPRVPMRSRLFLASDLLTEAEPGLLHRFAGRAISGAMLHLRVPEVWSPPSDGFFEARDAETGARKTMRWTPARSAAVTEAASAHALRWEKHAREVGLAYLPFAPQTSAEDVFRRLALGVA